MEERGNFGSKLGIIFATAGSAVGLGNIWRFPTEAGNNGGGAFLLVYILCVVLMGVPLMVAEFAVGRHSRANTGSAFRILSKRRSWGLLGKMEVLAAFLILAYYSVVAGWTLYYAFQSLLNRFNVMARQGDSSVFADNFNSFVSDPWLPLLCLAAFLFATHFVVVRGVKSGIERSSKILMPFLFHLKVVLVVCALTKTGAAKKLEFFFTPDFSKIDSGVVMSAMAQAFYSLSLGMGCMCTYASYFKRDANITKTAFTVGLMDMSVAVMAGIVIFPAVFSVPGLEPDAGPSLVFIALPNVFQMAMGGIPAMAYVCSLAFYVLLVVATLTSTISLHEVVTAYLSETRNMPRRRAAWYVTGGSLVLGIFCSLSLGVLSGMTVAGMTIFDLFDYVTAKIMLLAAGFLTSVFVGWVLKPHALANELTNWGTLKLRCFSVLVFMLRYVEPLINAELFLDGLGLLNIL